MFDHLRDLKNLGASQRHIERKYKAIYTLRMPREIFLGLFVISFASVRDGFCEYVLHDLSDRVLGPKAIKMTPTLFPKPVPKPYLS